MQGSNSIEGYDASLDDVVAAIAGEESLDASTETRLALEGYRDAMTYVLQLAREPVVRVDESLVKSLHFMMLKHDLRKNPGRWRPGSVYVRREPDGEVVYEGPDAEMVPALIPEVLAGIGVEDGPALLRAAMAHLNLAMIHPFSDGNGRMARCLQTLVLARERILSPEFNSIEEYWGRNTQGYYDVLAEVGRGSWQPHNDAPWVRFCLTAHYRRPARCSAGSMNPSSCGTRSPGSSARAARPSGASANCSRRRSGFASATPPIGPSWNRPRATQSPSKPPAAI